MTAARAAAFQAGQLARNLLAGVRLALFLPLRAEAFRVSAPQFALLVLFNFAVWVGVAAARSGFEGEFQPSAVMVYLANVALVLATAFLVALVYGAPERLLLIAIALSASDALFDLSALALVYAGAAEREPTALYVVFVLWAWLASLRAAVVSCGWGQPRVYFAAVAVSLMTALALYLIPDADVWQLPEGEEEEMQALPTT
jgi:hypothetical protein